LNDITVTLCNSSLAIFCRTLNHKILDGTLRRPRFISIGPAKFDLNLSAPLYHVFRASALGDWIDVSEKIPGAAAKGNEKFRGSCAAGNEVIQDRQEMLTRLAAEKQRGQPLPGGRGNVHAYEYRRRRSQWHPGRRTAWFPGGRLRRLAEYEWRGAKGFGWKTEGPGECA
jgi:hypothetical protein